MSKAPPNHYSRLYYRLSRPSNAISIVESVSPLKFVQTLRSGSFGTLVEMNDTLLKNDVAVKISKKKYTSAIEIIVWPKLNHENVVCLQEIIEIDRKYVAFVMPLEDTNLKSLLKRKVLRHDGQWLQHIKMWILDIAKGLNYLHAKKIAHLDLKPSKVLITKDLRAVVCDLSYSKPCSQLIASSFMDSTLIYSPPEFFTCHTIDGTKWDSWQFFVTVMEILTNQSISKTAPSVLWFKWGRISFWHKRLKPTVLQLIFQSDNLYRLVRKSFKVCPIEGEEFSTCWNFVQYCFCLDPERRLLMDPIIRHSFLQQVKEGPAENDKMT